MVRQEYFIVLSIYFFFFCPGFGRLPLRFRGGDVLIVTGGFGRIGLAGGDTLRASSLSRLAWIPFLGITYRSGRLMDDDNGFSTSLEVVGGTGSSAYIITLGAAPVMAFAFDDLGLRANGRTGSTDRLDKSSLGFGT